MSTPRMALSAVGDNAAGSASPATTVSWGRHTVTGEVPSLDASGHVDLRTADGTLRFLFPLARYATCASGTP